jgi:hypothetical protein
MRAAAVLRNAAASAANAAKPKPMSADPTLYHLAPTVSRSDQERTGTTDCH